jgi:hypothetical protein
VNLFYNTTDFSALNISETTQLSQEVLANESVKSKLDSQKCSSETCWASKTIEALFKSLHPLQRLEGWSLSDCFRITAYQRTSARLQEQRDSIQEK